MLPNLLGFGFPFLLFLLLGEKGVRRGGASRRFPRAIDGQSVGGGSLGVLDGLDSRRLLVDCACIVDWDEEKW